MLRLGWFSTGRGPGSRNLLKTVMEKKDQGVLDADISFVFCNWDNTEEPNPKKDQRKMFFDMVEGYGIPLVKLSWKSFRPDLWESDQSAWRDEYGKEMRKHLARYEFDIGVLAGYMLWMDDISCNEYDLINLHPALPDGPKGTWQDVIWQLIRENAERQGSMIHLCTVDWDRGAALTYCGFPIHGGEYDRLWESFGNKLKSKTFDEIRRDEGENEPLFRKIREDGAKRELPLIVSTIKQFADRKVSIKGQRLYLGDRQLGGPFDLSNEVDDLI